jgi:hypothetical protein
LSTTTSRRPRHWVHVSALMLVALTLQLAGTADPAMAEPEQGEPSVEPLSAEGCHSLHLVRPRRVCIEVQGSGLTITSMRSWWEWESKLCNTRIRIAFFDNNNSRYLTYTSPRDATCQVSDVFANPGNYPKTVRAGRVCGSFQVGNAAWSSGACVGIHS